MILGTNTRGDGKVLCLFLCSPFVYNEGRSPLFLSFSSQQSNYIIQSDMWQRERRIVLLLERSRRKPREIGCVSMRFTERSSDFSQYTYTLFCDRSPNDEKLSGVVL
jgi:hypothetical protein